MIKRDTFVIEHDDGSQHTVERLFFKDNVFAKLIEDAVPMNSCSAGQVAGIGIGPKGEPGVKRRKLKRFSHLMRQSTPK